MSQLARVLVIGSLFTISSAYALEDGAYMSFSGGISNNAKVKNKDVNILYTLTTEFVRDPNIFERQSLDFKRGFNVRAALGYRFNQFRVEAESSVIQNKYKNFYDLDGDIFPGKWSGYTRATSLLINGYYDYPLNDWLVPYVGTGIGFARVKNHIRAHDRVDVIGGVMTPISDPVGNMHETKVAYQAIIGSLLNLSNKLSLSADYRYFGTQKLKALDKSLVNHSFNLGVHYKF